MGEVEAESRGGAVAQFRPREVIPLFDIALGASGTRYQSFALVVGVPCLLRLGRSFYGRITRAAPIIPALSRPAFARDGSGRFLCGTEEQHPQR
jgi:hypothetical protein